ncbi:hypothetical protein ACOSP7_016620 [Xanthoceras sorbifolium]
MSTSPIQSPQLGPPSWNPLVISLVAFVCTALVVISYFKIVKQLCSCAINGVTYIRNQEREQRQLLNDPNPNDSSFYSHGLESSIINSLPIGQFKKKKEQEQGPNHPSSSSSSSADCAVCLGEFEEGEWLKHLPNCGHAFHSSCIDIWFESHSNCPLCRSYVCDLSIPFECSVSMYTSLETLRREDFFHERADQYHVLRSAMLQNQNPSVRYEATSSD